MDQVLAQERARQAGEAMIVATCDLCGRHCQASEMAQLLESYQVDGITDICPSCQKKANKAKSDLLGEITPKMREAIRAMAAEHGKQGLEPAPKKGWLRRLLA